MAILETKRLILRAWQKSDVESMFTINQDPKVMEYYPSLQDKAQTQRFIERINQHQNKHGFSLYVVELKSTGEMIGYVGLLRPDFEAHFTPTVEIGWRLASQFWGQGYATEAAKAVLHYAFTQINLTEIVSFTTKDNLKSRRVMQKIGLSHDPKDDFDHPNLDKKNPLCRHVLYRITKQEYLANQL